MTSLPGDQDLGHAHILSVTDGKLECPYGGRHDLKPRTRKTCPRCGAKIR